MNDLSYSDRRSQRYEREESSYGWFWWLLIIIVALMFLFTWSPVQPIHVYNFVYKFVQGKDNCDANTPPNSESGTMMPPATSGS